MRGAYDSQKEVKYEYLSVTILTRLLETTYLVLITKLLNSHTSRRSDLKSLVTASYLASPAQFIKDPGNPSMGIR